MKQCASTATPYFLAHSPCHRLNTHRASAYHFTKRSLMPAGCTALLWHRPCFLRTCQKRFHNNISVYFGGHDAASMPAPALRLLAHLASGFFITAFEEVFASISLQTSHIIILLLTCYIPINVPLVSRLGYITAFRHACRWPWPRHRR